MRSFYRQIEANGGTYTAQYISEEELAAILGLEVAEVSGSSLYFPQYVTGDGIVTEFIMVNNCSEERSGSIIFYSNDMTGESGEVVWTEPWTMAPGGVLVEARAGESGDPLEVGAVEIEQDNVSSCGIEATEFINIYGSYTTVNGAELRNTHQLFAQRDARRETGFAMYNPGSREITVDVYYLSEGEETWAQLSLAPHGHLSIFLGELMPSIGEETSGTLNFFADRQGNAMVSITAGPDAQRASDL